MVFVWQDEEQVLPPQTCYIAFDICPIIPEHLRACKGSVVKDVGLLVVSVWLHRCHSCSVQQEG